MNLSIKCKSIKLLNMGKNLCNVGLDKELLDMTVKSMILSKIHKLDLTTIKKFCYVKQPVKSMKRWKTYLPTMYMTKNQYLKKYKESQNSTVKKQTTQLENRQRY